MPEYDPFAPTPSGFTDEVTGTTTQVEFKAGQFDFQATFTIKRDEPEVHSQSGELLTEKWVYLKIGTLNDWRAVKGGAAFEHVSGENYNAKGQSKVRADSKFWRVVECHLDLIGRGPLLAKGTPFEAAMFEGWHLAWETGFAGEKFKVKDKSTGETSQGLTKGFLIPVALLGEAGPAFDMASLALAPDQLAYLEAAANDSTTLGEFQAAVMPWMHKAETGLSDSQKAGLNSAVATNDGWMAIRTLI